MPILSSKTVLLLFRPLFLLLPLLLLLVLLLLPWCFIYILLLLFVLLLLPWCYIYILLLLLVLLLLPWCFVTINSKNTPLFCDIWSISPSLLHNFPSNVADATKMQYGNLNYISHTFQKEPICMASYIHRYFDLKFVQFLWLTRHVADSST